MPYWEGQSYGVIPPGTNPKNGKPNSVRICCTVASAASTLLLHCLHTAPRQCHAGTAHQVRTPRSPRHGTSLLTYHYVSNLFSTSQVRLYSIASSRYGDDMTGTTTSLCVRRNTYSAYLLNLLSTCYQLAQRAPLPGVVSSRIVFQSTTHNNITICVRSDVSQISPTPCPQPKWAQGGHAGGRLCCSAPCRCHTPLGAARHLLVPGAQGG